MSDLTAPPTDTELRDAQERSRTGSIDDVHALPKVEQAHLDAQPELTTEDRQKMGTIAIDREGDTWRWGRTRWTCLTPIDDVRVLSVGRLPQGPLIRQYGPLKVIGDKNGWRYQTIRGRH